MTKTEESSPRETSSDEAATDMREPFLRALDVKDWRAGMAQGGGETGSLQAARQSLEFNMLGALDPVRERERISAVTENLDKIGERVARGEISAGQAVETFRHVDRLLTARAATDLMDNQRQSLSEQVLSHVASPGKIDQGRYNTCNVAAAEVVAYSRTPERAAALVADIALKGEYTASYNNPNHGPVVRTVKVDPTPHGESLSHPAADGTRNHASEIFQLTAINLAWDASDDGLVRYRQTEPDLNKPWDAGERFELRDATTGDYSPYIPELTQPPDPANTAEVDRALELARQYSDGIYMRNFQPNLQPAHMGLVAEIITGKTSAQLQAGGQKIFMGTNEQSWNRLAQDVINADELYDILKNSQQTGELPRMITINAAKEPFATEVGYSGRTAWHNITVHGLAERPGQEPRVLISNQWGDDKDHLSWDNGIPLSRFFDAMRS